jgi:methylglutaconyl-CoA hydratase
VNADEDILIVEKAGTLAWLKLNRPSVHNCLNRQLLEAIINTCEELKEDEETRVVAIIGAGTKVFCAGADLSERMTLSEAEIADYHSLIQKTMLAVESLPQCVIAAMNGSAFGGGTELALACDLRVIVQGAIMKMTEVRLGIIPGAGGTQRLPRLIGKTRAKEMILAASAIDAQKAYEYGLVNRVIVIEGVLQSAFNHPLMDAVRDWAGEIASAAPLALRQAKIAINAGCDQDLAAGLALETKAYLKLLGTKDRQEGLAAFAEKRQPRYVGE